MQIDFTCQLTQIEVLRGIWRRIISMAIDAEYFYFQKKKTKFNIFKHLTKKCQESDMLKKLEEGLKIK